MWINLLLIIFSTNALILRFLKTQKLVKETANPHICEAGTMKCVIAILLGKRHEGAVYKIHWALLAGYGRNGI